MHEHLPALAVKVAKMLSIKSEYVVTQPAELRILGEMSEADVREFAKSHGWRVIRRLGGRQIEFYNDASRLTAVAVRSYNDPLDSAELLAYQCASRS